MPTKSIPTKTSAPAKAPLTLEGTMTLECSPEELIAESRTLGDLWMAAIDETIGQRSLGRRTRSR